MTGLLLVTAIGLAFILDDGADPGRALEFKSGGVALWAISRALAGPPEPIDPARLVD